MHFFILLSILPLQWSGCRDSKPKKSNEIFAQHKVHLQEVDPLIKIESSGPMPPAIHEILEGILKSKWAQTGKRYTDNFIPYPYMDLDAVPSAFGDGEKTGTVMFIRDVFTEKATSLTFRAFQFDGKNGSGIVLSLTSCYPVTPSCQRTSRLDNPEHYRSQQGPSTTKKPLLEYVRDIIDDYEITDDSVVMASVYTASFGKNSAGDFRFSFSQGWNSRIPRIII